MLWAATHFIMHYADPACNVSMVCSKNASGVCSFISGHQEYIKVIGCTFDCPVRQTEASGTQGQ